MDLKMLYNLAIQIIKYIERAWKNLEELTE